MQKKYFNLCAQVTNLRAQVTILRAQVTILCAQVTQLVRTSYTTCAHELLTCAHELYNLCAQVTRDLIDMRCFAKETTLWNAVAAEYKHMFIYMNPHTFQYLHMFFSMYTHTFHIYEHSLLYMHLLFI